MSFHFSAKQVSKRVSGPDLTEPGPNPGSRKGFFRVQCFERRWEKQNFVFVAFPFRDISQVMHSERCSFSFSTFLLIHFVRLVLILSGRKK
jgi:hypothetical protein